MRQHKRSRGLRGFVERHRVATTFVALFLMASPARPDDRQLLQANAGANTNVLLILDSSHSMNNDFSDTYRLPAFMDDFIYPEGTVATEGSRLGVAKSVLRQVMTNTSGVNWAFSYFRNPVQTFGAADTSAAAGTLGEPIGGATVAGQNLENGGLEWLYFADALYPSGNPISGVLPTADYPDLQQGRFLQMGHKVPHIYGTPGQPDLPPYIVAPQVPDPRFPYPGPDPGSWRGAFGPKGFADLTPCTFDALQNCPMVVYRSPSKAGYELRMSIVNGQYADPFVVVQIEEWGPPAAPTPTPTSTPTDTNTPTLTRTATSSRTATLTRTPTSTPSSSRTATATRTNTRTATETHTATVTSTASNTPTRTATFTATSTFTSTQTRTATNTPSTTATFTSTRTLTPTFTASASPTRTSTNTPSVTSTASNTPSRTSTGTNTPSRTATQTFTRTFTPSATNTPSNTPTRTATFTATRTFTNTQTFTPTFTRTNTNTPSRTNTPSNTATRTNTNTPSRTNTPSNTATRTNTASATATRTSTNTPSRTNTPSNTATRTSTNTPSRTNTPSNTATRTNTPSNTATATNTPSFTATFTATRTHTSTRTSTRTNTASHTATRTPTRTSTFTATQTFTASRTPTGTPPPTPTFTPTLVPTLPGGAMPGKSLLPAITGWLAPAIRGLFAMAPPPPPPGPCPGIPSGYTGGLLECSPCPYDATRQCAFVDTNGDGVIDPGEPAPSNLIPLPASPVFMRGFDDPQADPDSTLVLVQRIEVRFVRGDLYSLPPVFTSNDTLNGNPPWGSCPTATAGCPAAPDNDADAQVDPSSVADRHNQGMFSAIYDKERPRPTGQFPNDAFGGPSCPLGIVGCDPYVQDCGGYAHFNSYKGYPASAPTGLTTPYLYPSNPPASPDDWPVVPFRREWLGTDYPGGNSPESAIKRLLRFSSSIVSYNYGAPADSAYSLAENANEVAVTAPGTPIAGTLLDAYNYFVNTVFQPPTSGAPDPAIDCRNYIIVFVTDGHDECGSDPCSGGLSGLGPSGDLGQVLLPESTAGARAAAAANDPSIRTTGVPVYVVGLNSNAAFFPALQCVADNSGGQLFAATDRTQLQAALESILDFKRNASFFASPSSPAFAGGLGDTAQIGSVVPSHLNPNGDLSSWSVWSGTVKSFQLDANGLIPVVTAGAPTTTPTPSGPTNTPSVSTPTPTPTPLPGSGFFVDETNPDDTDPAARKPVWSAGRVLGYTDPVANLAAGAVPSAASPASRAPAIDVWPGRKMIFSRGTGAAIPMQRADFLPNTGTCVGAGTPGSCFDDLMTNMNLIPTSSVANQTLARLTVQFLRGGATTFGSRDEILNDASIRPATIGVIGPGVGEEQKFSYFYQDDAPSPGEPPQVRTDDDGTPPAGYAHKLGDIFHSEPMVIEPPQYYQYLVANLTPTGTTTPQPYLDFANLHAKRRKVLYVGANDGFFHAFDSGVWGRDTTNFPAAHDLGTGREIFAYSPRSVMGSQMPNLLDFPPLPQYFVDGSPSSADVFIDPAFAGTPDPTERVWRTILVSGLRQGGEGYFALDVTQPDDIVTAAGPTLGEIVGNKDAVPACLNGGGGSCNAGAASNRPYPSILWEFADAGATCSDGCATVATALGETWSKPVIGRIRLFNDPGPPAVFEDRYVAIFGGGYDPGFTQGDDVATRLPNGRALYIVDVETGDILYKTTEGAAGGSGTPVNFAPMPSAPGVIDYDDDGYLDAVYIGDVNGNMWRLSLVPDAPNGVGDVSSGQISGYQPFLLFNGCGALSGACPNRWPIFFEPGVIFLGGSVNPPTLGIAFGTGNRAELAQPNAFTQEFFYVVDTGQTATTFQRTDLHDLTPPNAPCPLPYDPVACAGAQNGFVLDFASQNEKTTSTVFSTFGNLSVITFTPDSVSPCATNGSSYRYVFFFLTGQGAYDADGAGNPGIYGDYVQTMGPGVAVSNQSISQSGGMHQTTMVEDELLQEQEGNVQTLERNWKEQQ